MASSHRIEAAVNSSSQALVPALSPDLVGPFLTTGDNRPLTEALILVPRPDRAKVFSTIAATAISHFNTGRIDSDQLAKTVKGLVALDDTADVDPRTGRRRRAFSFTSEIVTQLEKDEEALAAVVPQLDTKTLIALNCPGLDYCTPRQVAGIIGNMAHFIHPSNDLEPADDKLNPRFNQPDGRTEKVLDLKAAQVNLIEIDSPPPADRWALPETSDLPPMELTDKKPLLGIFAANAERLQDGFGRRHSRLTTLIASVLERAETADILEDPQERETESMFPAQVLEQLLKKWRPGKKMPRTVRVLIDLAVHGGNKSAVEFLTQHPDTNQALFEAATGPFDPLEEE